MTTRTIDTPLLIERQVTLLVSQDTQELWDLMTTHLGLESFDQTVQMLSMLGAFLVASADLGYLENLCLDDLTPEAVQAVIVPWLRLRLRTGQPTGQEHTEREEGDQP